jgi:tetratricopeptide (TPR) repeat protein
MPFNKQRTSTTTKVLIVVLIVALVGGVLLAGTGGLFGLFAAPPTQSTTSQAPAGSYEAISAKHLPAIQSDQTALAKNPKSFALLVALGNEYFDFANEVQNQQALAQQNQQLPLWTSSIGFYERALASTKTLEPRVATDLSVAYHYAGQNPKAITLVTRVLKVDPTLPQAVIDAGQFYESAGQTATAVAFYKKFTTLAGTDAQSVAFAKSRIQALGK